MFKPGISGNLMGRPHGTPNRVTGDLRQRVNDLWTQTFDQILNDFEALEPRDRVAAWCRLAEYALPKVQRTENVLDVSKLSDDEVDALLNRILQRHKEHEP